MNAYLEIRTSEGGQDAKLLVQDMAANYQKVASIKNLSLSAYS